MTTVAISQPTYLPWLGYFDLIASSDVFVILDHVQFSKQSWQQRNRIRDRRGEVLLTVPVKKTRLETPIMDVELADASFRRKHTAALKNCYQKASRKDLHFPAIDAVLRNGVQTHLVDLNLDLIRVGCKHLGINTPLIRSSELDVPEGRLEGLVWLCDKFDADHYLSPAGSRRYLEGSTAFEDAGIEVRFQDYHYPTYRQCNHTDFISHLSFIDYLFNVDPDETPFRI